jgi:L-ascorbate metabolism protein UlaG (beta-lactamase superfamily)
VADPLSSADFTLRWIGHATVRLELDGLRVLTDPVLRERLGPLRRYADPVEPSWYDEIDVVVISHLHSDHLDLPSLRRLDPGTRLVVPRGAAPFVRTAGLHNVEELGRGERLRIGPLCIEATPAAHDGYRWRRPYGPVAEAVGYLIEGSTRVYFAGDTDLFSELEELRDRAEVALLPVGGWGLTLGPGHLDPARATQALRLIRPRLAVPVHWGTLWTSGLRQVRRDLFDRPGPQFAELARELAPDVEVAVLTPGELRGGKGTG